MVWDKATGQPVHRAIVWQDRRTADRCIALADSKGEIAARTGLVLDAYFSATKIEWLLRDQQCAGAACGSGGVAVRDGRYVAHLAAHRRCRPRHGSHQCQPHDAVRHRRARVEPGAVFAVRDPDVDAARGADVARRFRRGGRPSSGNRAADHRRGGGPAVGAGSGRGAWRRARRRTRTAPAPSC